MITTHLFFFFDFNPVEFVEPPIWTIQDPAAQVWTEQDSGSTGIWTTQAGSSNIWTEQ